MKLTAIILLVVNIWLWVGTGPIPSAERPAWEEKITALERLLPALREAASWSVRVAPLAAEAERAPDMADISRRLQTAGVTLTEAGHRPGQADAFEWAGHGEEPAIARFLTLIEREPGLVVKSLSLHRRDDGLIEFRTEVGIKPASGTLPILSGYGVIGRPETFPEPVAQIQATFPTGRRGLFGRKEQPVIRSTVRVKYLGFYAGSATPSVILEENGGVAVLRVGDKTPAGLKLRSADESIVLLETGRNEAMRVEMEKKR